MHSLRAKEYQPRFISGGHLVPAVAHLRAQLTASFLGGEPQRRDLAFHLEQLPYALGGAYLAVSECMHVMATVADRHSPNGNEFVVVPEDQRFLVGYKVDAFFDAARRAQNALGLYWSRALNLSLPTSLADIVTDIGKGRCNLPSNLQEVVGTYWASHGSRIKAYRDLYQHRAVIISDVRVHRARGGNREVVVFAALPSNPSVTKIDGLAYTPPVVLALDFLITELLELIRFVNKALRPVLIPRENFESPERLIIRSAVRNEKEEEPLGSPVPTQEYLKYQVKRLAPELQLDRETGVA